MTTPYEYGTPNDDGTHDVEATPIGQAKEIIRLLDAPDFQQMRRWFLQDEVPRREQAAGQAELIKSLRDNGHVPTPVAPAEPTGAEDFDPWQDPGTDHGKMYLLGDRVQHNGRVWESQVNGINSWEPGGAGVYSHIWADVTDLINPPDPHEDSTPVWAAGIDYAQGDTVTYEDAFYTVLQAHTSQADWTPNTVPALYEVN